MANQILTPLWTLKRVGRMAINNLKFANNVDRSYDDEFVQAGAKVGDTINLRLPWVARTEKGQAFVQQGVVDRIVPVTLTDQAHGDIGMSSFQLTVDVDDYAPRYIDPIAVNLANTIDLDGLERIYQAVWNAVGTPGTTPTANSTFLAANTLLSNNAAPPIRNIITTPELQAAITNANFALFNPQGKIGDSFETGVYSNDTLGFRKWFWDQNVASHTVGTYSGTPLVNGANQTGNTLVTDGWGSGVSTLNKGDIFTIGAAAGGASSTGVFMVNTQSKRSTRALQQFVVSETVSDVTGAMTITFEPAIVTSGNFQNVTAAPVDNAVITVMGASGVVSTESLAWVREAVVMVMADLVKPEGGAISERISSKPLGFSLRLAKQWQILTDQNLARVDCVYGWKAYRPEWIVRIRG